MIRKTFAFMGKPLPLVRISRLNSLGSPGLQVFDFIASGVKRKHESGDSRYFEIIAPKLTELR